MQVQIRHVPFNIDTVNQEPLDYLNGGQSGPMVDKPDQFWILNNMLGGEYYSVGKFETGHVPKSINGIPTNVQERGGKWTYHGPGQVSFVILVNIKRLARQSQDPDRTRAIVKLFKEHIEQFYSVKLEYNDNDPGLYFLDGSKIGSFGNESPSYGWIAIKLSINLNVNTHKFDLIDTCGVANRAMANLLPQETITAELTSIIGERMVRSVIDRLYEGQAEVTVRD